MNKGKHKWIPKNVIDELNRYKISEGIKKDCDAFRQMAKDAKIGGEIRTRIAPIVGIGKFKVRKVKK